jgi:nucleotide-binding universal stress UspA family protein
MTTPKTILVATDFSEHADYALEYAANLGAQLGATVHLVHAITLPIAGGPELAVAFGPSMIESLTKYAQAALDTRTERYRDRVELAPSRIEIGDPRDVIDRAAEQVGADLIVIGTHGRRGVKRLLLGSVAEAIVRTAPCPVLTLRPRWPS